MAEFDFDTKKAAIALLGGMLPLSDDRIKDLSDSLASRDLLLSRPTALGPDLEYEVRHALVPELKLHFSYLPSEKAFGIIYFQIDGLPSKDLLPEESDILRKYFSDESQPLPPENKFADYKERIFFIYGNDINHCHINTYLLLRLAEKKFESYQPMLTPEMDLEQSVRIYSPAMNIQEARLSLDFKALIPAKSCDDIFQIEPIFESFRALVTQIHSVGSASELAEIDRITDRHLQKLADNLTKTTMVLKKLTGDTK